MKKTIMKSICGVLSVFLIMTAAGCSQQQSETQQSTETQKPSETQQTTETQQTQPSQSVAETVSAEITDQLDQVLKKEQFKGIVQIKKGSDVIYRYVDGEDGKKNPLTIDASMPIGSVSKQFCAACIMFLCEQDKLSVDDTIDKFYPDCKYGKKMTVKNLLNMSSGIKNYLDIVDPSEIGANELENINTITKKIFEQELKFEPGSDYEYSNSNYFLLANIVEQASGIAYHKFLREQFFEPLEMTHTGFVDEILDNAELASALSSEELNNEFYHPGLTKGAGDVISNAEDMDKWMRGLSEGKILSAEGFRQMTESVNAYSIEDYGYGLRRMPFGGVGHEGQIPPSYGAVDYINTERDVRLFAMSNTGQGMSYVQEIPQALLSVLFEEK